MRIKMKAILSIAVVGLAVAAVAADCGAKDTHQGTLKSVDTDSNVVVLEDMDGNQVELTLTEKTEVKNSKGEKAKAATLVGEKVKIVSEHAKIDSIKQMA